MSAAEATLGKTSEAGGVLASVVIPLYNEQDILDENLALLSDFFDRVVGPAKWQFVLVENGSTDRTPELIEKALKRYPLTNYVRLPDPNYGVALKTGLRAATTDWIFVVDIEQWDLPFIAWSWKNRDAYELFIGSKRADPTICHQHYYRKVLSCGLNGLLQLTVQFTGTDTHGPKLINRNSLRDIIDVCELDRGQFDTELVLRAIRGGKKVIEIPTLYRELRPNRNWMVKKIIWNLGALRRLVRVMNTVPQEGYTRYYRLGREEALLASREFLDNFMDYDRH